VFLNATSSTLTRSEGRVAVCVSELTTKAATLQGDSAEFVPVLKRKCVLLTAWCVAPSPKNII